MKKDFIVRRSITMIDGKPHVETYSEQELVRCKNCKHRTRRICNNIEFWECNHIRYELAKCGVTDDWFCADGERR